MTINQFKRFKEAMSRAKSNIIEPRLKSKNIEELRRYSQEDANGIDDTPADNEKMDD